MLYVPTWTRVRRRAAAAAAIVPESDAGRARAEVADQSSAAASPSPAEQRPVTAVRGREPVRMVSGCARARDMWARRRRSLAGHHITTPAGWYQ